MMFLQDSKGGLIEATPYAKLLVLPFGKADCKWTLFMNDRVTFQVVTDLVTRAKRATSVKPQFPNTVQFTRERREMVSLPTLELLIITHCCSSALDVSYELCIFECLWSSYALSVICTVCF